MVIELPPGPLICIAMDLNQRWVLDMGLPGPDAGGAAGTSCYRRATTVRSPTAITRTATTYRVMGGIRSLPVGGDVQAATERLKTVKVHPLDPPRGWADPTWLDLTPEPQDTTPDRWEDNLGYWEALHEVVDSEPPFDGYRAAYGELAALGIAKGQPFAPDDRMTAILERAAEIGTPRCGCSPSPTAARTGWSGPDRQWEWAALRFENGDFRPPGSVDADAREKWFFQAIGESPAMFRRDTQRRVPVLARAPRRHRHLPRRQPHLHAHRAPARPGQLFWSVTVYDARHPQPDPDRAGQSRAQLPVRLRRPRPDASRSTCTSGPPPRRPPAAGSRPSPAQAGSSTSASTAPRRPPSIELGSQATSKRPIEPCPELADLA